MVRGPKRSSSEAASGSFHQRVPAHRTPHTSARPKGTTSTAPRHTAHRRPTPSISKQKSKHITARHHTLTPDYLFHQRPTTALLPLSTLLTTRLLAFHPPVCIPIPPNASQRQSNQSVASASSSSPVPQAGLIAFVTTTSPHCFSLPAPAPVCRHLSHGCRYDRNHHRPLPRPLRRGAPGACRPRARRPAISLGLLHLPSTKSQVR